MPLYLLDADVIITANRDYYPIERIPQFWDWLLQQCQSGYIKIPGEIYTEITPKEDMLENWIKEAKLQGNIILDEEIEPKKLNLVLTKGYQISELSEISLEKIGRDASLIAYAFKNIKQRVVVTKEVSKPSKIGANRKIPDVCNDLGVQWIDDFELYRRLNFSIM